MYCAGSGFLGEAAAVEKPKWDKPTSPEAASTPYPINFRLDRTPGDAHAELKEARLSCASVTALPIHFYLVGTNPRISHQASPQARRLRLNAYLSHPDIARARMMPRRAAIVPADERPVFLDGLNSGVGAVAAGLGRQDGLQLE